MKNITHPTYLDSTAQPTIDSVVTTTICRHCGNARVPNDPTICTDCQRCIDPGGCGHSPECPEKE